MPAAPLPPDELDRLSMLDALHLLDTPPEPVFDRVTRLASRLLDMPMALFSLVDADRQWFKSRVGFERAETPREHAFCAHAIGMSAPLVVSDARDDGRFRDNPLVNGPPNIRFYAGVPIRTTAGLAIGSLCVLDSKPRTLGEDERQLLDDLAAILASEVQYRERMAVAGSIELDEARRMLTEAVGRQRAAEAELRAREEEIKSVVENAYDAYVSLDEEGMVRGWNRRAEETFGWPREEALGRGLDELIVPEEYREQRQEGMRQFLATRIGGAVDQRLEVPARRRDGSALTVEVRTRALEMNGRTMYSVFLHDVSARQQEQAQREYESRHDQLTGLLNRRALLEALPVAQARAGRSGKTVGMLFIDLDGFKAVNDSLGHEAGDALLREIADRLRAAVRKTDSVYRLAGDEFTVLLEDMADTFDDAHIVAEKLIASISEPVMLPGRAMRVRASIGIALDSGQPARAPDELLKEAGHFMYQAKKAGRGRVCSARHPH